MIVEVLGFHAPYLLCELAFKNKTAKKKVSCSVTVITVRALVFLYLIWYMILDAIFQN